MDVPSHAAVQCPALEYAPEVGLCRRLLIGVDKRQERFANEEICLLPEVAGKHRIEVEKAEFRCEERPI